MHAIGMAFKFALIVERDIYAPLFAHALEDAVDGVRVYRVGFVAIEAEQNG